MADIGELIASEGGRLAALAGKDPARRVPQYPKWTLADLVSHTGSIVGRTTMICRDRLQERPTAPRLPDGEDPVEWFESHLAEMLEVFEHVDTGTPVWGFGPQPNVEFWIKRMLIEVGIHRWDAEMAFGRPIPLLDEVAEAGLDEFPSMWLPHLGELPPLEVNATNFDHHWQYGSGDPVYTIEGTASDIYLRLMSRPSPVQLSDDWAAAVDGLEPPPR